VKQIGIGIEASSLLLLKNACWRRVIISSLKLANTSSDISFQQPTNCIFLLSG